METLSREQLAALETRSAKMPDGSTRLITLARWYWHNFDILTERYGVTLESTIATLWPGMVREFCVPHDGYIWILEHYIAREVKLEPWRRDPLTRSFATAASRPVRSLSVVSF